MGGQIPPPYINMDKFRIRYTTYDEYKTNKSSIPENAICYIEDRSIIVVKGKEYKCVGTVDLNDLDNFKADYTTANEQSGVYLVTTTYNTINCTCGILFQYNDSMGHATHQIILGNLSVSGGSIMGHGDLDVTVCYRSYGYASSYLTNGKWSDWKEIRISDLINISTTVTNLSSDVTKLKTTKYPVIATGSVSGTEYIDSYIPQTIDGNTNEIYCHRTTSTSPTNTETTLYIYSNALKTIIDKMAEDNIRYKTIKIKVLLNCQKEMQLGIAIMGSNSSQLSYSTQATWYNATDSSSRIYYRVRNTPSDRISVPGFGYDVELNIFRGTSSTSYTYITAKVII